MRNLIRVGKPLEYDLEIDIDTDRDRISITVPKLCESGMDFAVVPDEANLFHGSTAQFVEFMQRAKKKFGHLYK